MSDQFDGMPGPEAGGDQDAGGAGDQVQDETEIEWLGSDPALSFKAQVMQAQAAVSEMCSRFGFEIDQNDPEFGAVRWNHPDPNAWADDYADALLAKARRTGRMPRVRTKGVQPAVSPEQAQAAQAAQVEVRKEALVKELEALQHGPEALAPGAWEKRRKIEAELQKLDPPRRRY